MRRLIRFLGLRGSWAWACKQMDKGFIIRPASALGAVKYKLDRQGQRRIQWTFQEYPKNEKDWDNAYIFLSDIEGTDWVRWEETKP